MPNVPDLQPTLGAPAEDTDTLAGILRSQGSMPADALQALLPPPPGPALGLVQAAAGGAAIAQGHPAPSFLGGTSDIGAPQVLHMMERMQEQQARRAEREHAAALKLATGLTEHADPQVRTYGWEQINRLSGPLSLKIPPPILSKLGRGELSPTDLAKVVGLLDDGTPPEAVSKLTGLDPALVAQAAPIAQSDSTRRILKLPTRAEAAAGRVKDQQESLKLAREQWGLFEKDPRTPFALRYAQERFGVPFTQATPEQQKEAVEKSQVLSSQEPTSEMRNAMAEFNPFGDVHNPKDVQVAMNGKRARVQQDVLQRGILSGEASIVGRAYAQELNRTNIALNRIGQLDLLINDLDALIKEGKALGLTDNPQAMNAVKQFVLHGIGAPGSKAAAWYRKWDTTTARFATVAQSIEQITGNRLAVSAQTRALGYHPKQSDPYTVQFAMLEELRKASRNQRELASASLNRAGVRYGGLAGRAGVPFLIHEGEGGPKAVKAEEEE